MNSLLRDVSCKLLNEYVIYFHYIFDQNKFIGMIRSLKLGMPSQRKYCLSSNYFRIKVILA